MKVIICGAGQVGWQIARHLSGEKNDVTVVDVNAELVRRATETLDVMGCHEGDMSFVLEIGVCDFVAQWRQIPFLDVCVCDEFLHDRKIANGRSTYLDLLDCGHDCLLLSLCRKIGR